MEEKVLEDVIEPLREPEQGTRARQVRKKNKPPPTRIEIVHCDVIKDDFWDARPWILGE
jgi:tRNA(His) guanylyltransferase